MVIIDRRNEKHNSIVQYERYETLVWFGDRPKPEVEKKLSNLFNFLILEDWKNGVERILDYGPTFSFGSWDFVVLDEIGEIVKNKKLKSRFSLNEFDLWNVVEGELRRERY